MTIKVLAVEDSDQYQKMIGASFAGERNYQIEYVKSASLAIQMLENKAFDAFIVDVGLPDMNGFQLCSFIKSHPKYSSTPVIFLTGNDSIDDKEQGFSIGGNDYLTKPFHVRELYLRVKALTQKNSSDSHTIKVGDLALKTDSQRVYNTITQTELSLTKTEFQLLLLLGRNADKVISRTRILDQIWPNKLEISERTIDSHMSNLRKKVGGCRIDLVSVHSSGYRLEVMEPLATAS